MNPRRIMTVLLAVSISAALVLTITALINGEFLYAMNDIVAAGLLGGLLAAHLRGFRWTGQVLVTVVTLLVIAFAPDDPTQHFTFLFTLLAPAVLAGVLLPWSWSLGAFIAVIVGVGFRWGGDGLLFNPEVLVLLTLQASGIALASLVSRAAQFRAETNARRAEEALAAAEAQQQELARQAEVLRLKNKEQEQLLALVSALEIPTITLADGVIFAPIVGSLDSRRAKELTNRLLQATSRQRARLVIIDIAGMTIVDTMVAKSLVDASRAVRLLGCDVTITGISATVASTLVQLGVRLEGVEVARSPQEALAQYRERAAEWELPKRAINGALVAQANQPAVRR